jgi:chemotaxis protein methyltransferase CheR
MTLKPLHLDLLRALVLERSAIVLDAGKEYLVESRLQPLAAKLGYASLDDLLTRMLAGRDEDLRRRVVEAMTTNETSFFRDGHPFEVLHSDVLPQLLAARATRRQLDVWCAASSTGQEPYTIAMTMLEHVPELRRWRVRILATDLAEEMVGRARDGRFSQVEVDRGLPRPLRDKYFRRDGTHWCIAPEVKAMVEFRQMNLATPWPQLPRMDIVFLRNVLIYFDVAVKRRILAAAHTVLASDGWLCLGTAETTLGICDEFERQPIGKAVFYRPRQAAPAH